MGLEPFLAPPELVVFVAYRLREADCAQSPEKPLFLILLLPAGPSGGRPCSVEMTTKGKKLRRSWRILETEDSVAEAVQILLSEEWPR